MRMSRTSVSTAVGVLLGACAVACGRPSSHPATPAYPVAKAGDVAYSYGTYASSATGPDGKPMQDKGKYVTVYRKQADGSWKAVVDTFNSDLPMTPPPAPAPQKKK